MSSRMARRRLRFKREEPARVSSRWLRQDVRDRRSRRCSRMGELVMTFRITRTAPCVAGALLAAFSPVRARPVIIEDSTTVTSPDTSWEYFGRHVAVDGD